MLHELQTVNAAEREVGLDPVLDKAEETLANLGLPPNRRPGHMGFMVHETDGKFHPAAQGGCGHIHAGEWEDQVHEVKALEPSFPS